MIVDLGLPDFDGLDVCRRLRAAHSRLAIPILTARDQELDVVAGLDAGADDYLVKPFRLSELLARIRSHMPRVARIGHDHEQSLQLGDVRLDRAAWRAWVGEQVLALRPKEFDLLAPRVWPASRCSCSRCRSSSCCNAAPATRHCCACSATPTRRPAGSI